MIEKIDVSPHPIALQTVLMCFLQTINIEILKEMEKALEENKTLEKLTLNNAGGATLPREFCRHVLLGTSQNTSLSEMYLRFNPQNWDCPDDGRLVYACMSITCCATQLVKMYSVQQAMV